MAIYRLSQSAISRSNRSAIAAACYRSGDNLECKVSGNRYDYSKKKGIDSSLILLPEGANNKLLDRKTLWDLAEDTETYKHDRRGKNGYKRGNYIPNAEVAKELQLALPVELSKEEMKTLAIEFCQKELVSKGLACDVSFHDLDSHNPHCHIMYTTRSVEGAELGKKARWITDRDSLIKFRKSWEVEVNKTFVEKGIDERVTAERYKDRGLDIKAVSAKFNKYDVDYVNNLKAKNTKTISENIEVTIAALTDKKAVISRHDINSFLKRNVLESEIENIKEKIYSAENLVKLGNGKFTSNTYYQKEKDLIENINDLHNNKENLNKEVNEYDKQYFAIDKTLNPEQRDAYFYCLENDSNIKNIRGFAGAGKSWTIGAIVEAYKKSGFDVKGAALSGVVAEALAKDCKIEESNTIRSLINKYENGQLKITDKTILIIDEASMVGVIDYEKITNIVKTHGAKLINVGDEAQLKAINAGGANRLILENTSCVTLEKISRQKNEKDVEASVNFSIGKQREALLHYKKEQKVYEHNSKESMYSGIVGTYLLQTSGINSKGNRETAIVTAYKKDTVKNLNKIIQQECLNFGRLDPEISFKNKNGDSFYVGDRFMFTKNSSEVGVMNGTIGTIHEVKHNYITVKLDDDNNTEIVFDRTKYDDYQLAYASTIHKMQGATLDNAQLVMDKDTDSSLTLVGATRHRYDLRIHYENKQSDPKNGIEDFDDLVKAAEKKSLKELVKDYNDKILQSYKENNPNIIDEIEEKIYIDELLEISRRNAIEAERKLQEKIELDRLWEEAEKDSNSSNKIDELWEIEEAKIAEQAKLAEQIEAVAEIKNDEVVSKDAVAKDIKVEQPKVADVEKQHQAKPELEKENKAEPKIAEQSKPAEQIEAVAEIKEDAVANNNAVAKDIKVEQPKIADVENQHQAKPELEKENKAEPKITEQSKPAEQIEAVAEIKEDAVANNNAVAKEKIKIDKKENKIIQSILNIDKELAKENKKLKSNNELINKILELDRKAKQTLREYYGYKQNPSKFEHISAPVANYGNDIARDLFEERNELLESFEYNQDSFLEEVKNSKKFERVKQIYEKQKEYELEKEGRGGFCD
ncbi:AAA family ATPase [Francisella philomiragia]|uniref:AAA family ATPase n=1 Tax=Francisella philomiragia TaxID=28110 RepID=UPI001B8BBAB6|nr:AAA family ATPase [Francisella philomiragia]QUE32411.1 AAA family ATPase [Francisella philomiragia]